MDVPQELVADFLDTLAKLSIPFETKEHERRFYNGLEHYLPTVLVVFLAKPFFDAFLKEAGVDAYALFKHSLTSLIRRAALMNVKLVSSGQYKIQTESPYSRVISVYTRSCSEVPIKFLIPAEASEVESAEAVDAMLKLLQEHHIKNGDDRLSKMLAEIEMKSLQVFRYSIETRTWLLLPRNFGGTP